MKRYNNLWDKICTIGNFYQAYRNAVKGKKHYRDVINIRKYGVKKYLRELLEEVKTQKYRVSGYTVFHKFTGGKDREIYKLPMKDRIVQHAIMIYIEPIFRSNFIVDTFSSIKGRGIHRGLKRVKHAIRESGYNYCLKLDIKKCYPSLDKDILKQFVAKKFKDVYLKLLLFTIIDSCEHGVPIGNYTSLYFNNFYFSGFDHWLKEIKHVLYYFRYCDDMIILGESKQYLRDLFSEIQDYINTLNVVLKDTYQIFVISDRSVDFLGYKIKNEYVKIRKHTKHKFIRKVLLMNFDDLTDRNINVLGSYWGILKHANCITLWTKYTNSSAKGKFPFSPKKLKK